MRRIRVGFQIAFFTLFLILFIVSRFPFHQQIGVEFAIRFSPLLPLFQFLTEWKILLFLWPALVILILTPLIGRFFCGWICPLGAMLDFYKKVFRIKPSGKHISDTVLKRVKYILLIFFVVLALGNVHIWGILDPLSITTRLFTLLLYPIFTLLSEKGFQMLQQTDWTENLGYAAHDWFKSVIMPEQQFIILSIGTMLVLLFLIFGLEHLQKRFWCRYVCPAGAWLGLLSSFRFYERTVSPSCTHCNLCQTNCKMGAIPEGNVEETSKLECIECFDCGTKCPPKYPSIKYRWNIKPYHTPVDLKRRQVLGTLGVGFLTLSGFSFKKNNPAKEAVLIRPPGVENDEDFLEKCIRCMACVRICASNGACLQPVELDFGLEHFWTPYAVMRTGYCEYNCNLCMEVCPTEAIPLLSLKDKQKFVMGMAYFDKDLCIPYAENRDCIVCEEHCPLPDKAIKFERKEVTLPSGETKKVLFPYVDYKLCIGCGICETKCPLKGKPGIFVIRKDAVRLVNEQLPANPYGY